MIRQMPTFTLICACHGECVRNVQPFDILDWCHQHQAVKVLSDWAYDQLVVQLNADAVAALA